MKQLIIYGIALWCLCLFSVEIALAQNIQDTDNDSTNESNPFAADESADEDFLFEDEQFSSSEEESYGESFPLMTEVLLYAYGEGRLLNDDSRINPDNAIQNLAEGAISFEAHLTVSDYLNDKETFRWLFKSYGFYSNEENSNGDWTNVTRIDELFGDWKGGNLFLSVGKRRINWGDAMAFNPVNIIVPPRDPLDPNQETEGQPVAWGSLGYNFGTLDLIYTRDYDKEWSSDLNRWGARLGVVAGKFDASLYYFDGEPYQDGRSYERMLGLSFSSDLRAGITLYSEIAGFDRSYRNYYDSEGTASLKDELYLQGVIGSYIILNPEFPLSFLNGDANLTLEAYYNGAGYSETERKNYYNALDGDLREGNAAMLNDYRYTGMNQYYLLANYRNSFKERYTTLLSGLAAQDSSYSLQAELRYILSDYYLLSAKFVHNQGGKDTEFGNDPLFNVFECKLEIAF